MAKWSDAVLDMAPSEADASSEMVKDEPKNRVKWSEVIANDIGPQDSFVGDKPLGSVMTKLSNQGDSASFVTNMVAGLADDPQTQIKVYAASRFPDLPEPERLKRYGVHNGEVVYMGDDGNLYRETADTWFDRIKRFAAQTGSHLPSIILGTIGSSAGPGTAAVGAAGGEGIRKSLAATALGEEQTTLGNVGEMAKEGVLGYGGDLLGRLMARGLNFIGAKRGGELAKEAGRGRQNINIAETKRLEDLGQKFDIDLYPPQTTGSKRLADKFNLLGDLESSAPIIQKAREKQVEQIDDAVYKFVNDLMGDGATASEIGGGVIDASKKALQVPVRVRQAKASPLYKKAFESDVKVDVEPVAAWIDAELKTAKGDIRAALLRSKKLLEKPDLPQKIYDQSGNVIGSSYDTTLKGLHGTKVSLDAAKGKAKEGNVRYIYDKVKSQLLEQMDKASPDYATARKIFSEYSEEVTKQGKKTILGDISKLEGDKVVNATKKLFSSAEVKRAPEIVTKVKALIQKQDPEIWDKAVANHLQEVFESTKQSATGGITNIGGHFYKRVWGDLGQRKVLQAAMSPEQFQTLNDFMTVLSRSGMILGKESATASRQIMMEELGGRSLRSFVRAATRPLITKETVIGDRLLESLLYRNAKKLAEAMTSERAARQLEKMMRLPETAENLFPMVTNFMGMVISGEYSREKDREKKKDVLPEILRTPLQYRIKPPRQQ
jgi:hypothetical protein